MIVIFLYRKGYCHASKAGGSDSGSFFSEWRGVCPGSAAHLQLCSPGNRKNDPAGARGLFFGQIDRVQRGIIPRGGHVGSAPIPARAQGRDGWRQADKHG